MYWWQVENASPHAVVGTSDVLVRPGSRTTIQVSANGFVGVTVAEVVRWVLTITPSVVAYQGARVEIVAWVDH